MHFDTVKILTAPPSILLDLLVLIIIHLKSHYIDRYPIESLLIIQMVFLVIIQKISGGEEHQSRKITEKPRKLSLTQS